MRLIASTLFLAVSLAANPSFTIDQILSSPFPASLVGNGSGKVVWTESTKGVHNLWSAEAPAFEGRQITHFTEDDGQELTEIRLSADGAFVAYTRGEGA